MHDCLGHIKRMKQLLTQAGQPATHVTMNEEDYHDLCMELGEDCILYVEELEIVLDTKLPVGEMIVSSKPYTVEELAETTPTLGVKYVDDGNVAMFGGWHMN